MKYWCEASCRRHSLNALFDFPENLSAHHLSTPAMPPLKTSIICVHYSKAHLKPTLEAIAELCRDLTPQHVALVSNNRAIDAELESAAAEHGYRFFRHDNTGAEFGAYDTGLAASPAESDVFVFLNDTFAVHDYFTPVIRNRFVAWSRHIGMQQHPAIVGRIQTLFRSFFVGPKLANRWVTTSAFSLNRQAIQALGNRLYFSELNAWVRGGEQPERFFDESVDPVLGEHVLNWLFKPECEPRWYGAEPLSTHNCERMTKKARSILQEKYISATLENAHAEFRSILPETRQEKLLNRAQKSWIKARRLVASSSG
jgi:hypothetical protein